MTGFKYNPYEQRIMATLTYAYRPLTTKQISDIAKVSYNTTKHHLGELYKKKEVKKIDLGTRIYWALPNLLI